MWVWVAFRLLKEINKNKILFFLTKTAFRWEILTMWRDCLDSWVQRAACLWHFSLSVRKVEKEKRVDSTCRCVHIGIINGWLLIQIVLWKHLYTHNKDKSRTCYALLSAVFTPWLELTSWDFKSAKVKFSVRDTSDSCIFSVRLRADWLMNSNQLWGPLPSLQTAESAERRSLCWTAAEEASLVQEECNWPH